MLKQLPMTARQQRWKRKSKSSTSGEKPKSAKTSTAEPESQASVLRTPTTACFCSVWITDFQQLKLLRGDRVLMIGMIRTIAWLASLVLVELRTKPITLYLPFCQLSVIGHILTNQLLCCWADGGFEISKKRLQTVFSRLAFFPTRPNHPLSPSSLHVCVRDDWGEVYFF